MVKYLGILVLLVGALCLIYAGFQPSYDSNVVLGTGLTLTVLGYLLHIILERRSQA